MGYKIKGKCPQGCAKCCTSILPISKEEIKKIKQYIADNNIAPVNRNNMFTTSYVDVCPFLNYDNRCNIYDIRPEICSYFECEGERKDFHHMDKQIVNLFNVFYPMIKIPNAPDARRYDNIYQSKKSKIKGER